MLTEREANGRFSQQQIAAFAGVTPRAVRNWPLVPDDTDGTETIYVGKDVKAFWEKQAYDKGYQAGQVDAPKFDDQGDVIDIELEKARKLKAERIGQEIKNAQSLGELAPIDMLTAALGDAIRHLNTHLESVPASIKRVWPECPGHVLDSIERDIAQLRGTIADARIEFTDPAMGGGWSDGSGGSDEVAIAGSGGPTADGE
jgi:phage terminase Nu1 subunit (DNA packaging protein)